MATDRKRKTFHYKRANFLEKTAPLSVLLADSLRRLETLGERRQRMNPDDEQPVWRLVGDYSLDDAFSFGVLMRYVPGLHPACLIDDSTATTVTIEQLLVPNTEDGKAREMVADMLYFACFEDHMVLMQGGGLRAVHLEQHLAWLLRTAGVMSELNILSLRDTPTQGVLDHLDESPIREIDLAGDFLPQEERAADGADQARIAYEQQVTRTLRDEASGGMLDILARMLQRDPNSLIDKDDLLDANIGYTLTIRYKRSTTHEGQQLMDKLGHALRHAEGVEPTIHLVNGGKITGDQLRISGSVHINHYDGVPSSPEVFEEMRKWLLEKVKSSEVPT